MMEDKVTRRALIEKYLNAETTPEEERQLREWFAGHEADEDERDFALLIGLEAPCASCLPELDLTDAEFDRIMAAGGANTLRDETGKRGDKPGRHGVDGPDRSRNDSDRDLAPLSGQRFRWLVGLAAAAALAAIVWLALPSRKKEPSLPPVVIAESIRQILMLSPDDIESIEARPDGAKAILTAHLKDGTRCSYILTYDEDEGTTTLLACQNPSK
ncbi:MAG: hypothetical protein K6G79_06120 [Bacteroidales bacterium]|nr:hypothetical protein [Bacteroidales bacterium]